MGVFDLLHYQVTYSYFCVNYLGRRCQCEYSIEGSGSAITVYNKSLTQRDKEGGVLGSNNNTSMYPVPSKLTLYL